MRADIIKRFTDLGDPTFLLLGALAMFFYLWIDDGRRAVAGAWAASLGLCITLTIASKLLFYLHGWSQPGPLRLYSPSGHVAIATAFYGNCAMLLAPGHGKTFSLAVFGGTAALIALLAISRMLLGLHSAPEIAVALVIGLASLSLFHLLLATRPIVLRAGQPIALLVLIGVVRVSNVDGEALVGHLARNIASTEIHGLETLRMGKAFESPLCFAFGCFPGFLVTDGDEQTPSTSGHCFEGAQP